jgi:hypothetical protein
MVSQPKHEKEKRGGVRESDSKCKNDITGTDDEKKIRHQEPNAPLKSSSKNYKEYRHQPKIEESLDQKDK